jgi:hypothetical protein
MTWITNKLTIILAWLTIYFAPVYPLIAAIGFFVFADFLTGIQAAKKRGEKITSKKMKSTVIKFGAYGIAVVTSFLIEKFFLDGIPALKIISGLVAFIEVKSINENMKDITGTDIFGEILKRFPKLNK